MGAHVYVSLDALMLFRVATHLHPAVAALLGKEKKKKASTPGMGADHHTGDGVEDNLNYTVLAPMCGFRGLHPSQNSAHFRTIDK